MSGDKSDPRHPENKLERTIYKDFHGRDLPDNVQELAEQCFMEKSVTPDHVLRTQVMDHRIAKNEREQWAARRIAVLEARLELSPDHSYDGIASRDETIKQLEAENKRLREVIEHAPCHQDRVPCRWPCDNDIARNGMCWKQAALLRPQA
jgi:hypothetical protein